MLIAVTQPAIIFTSAALMGLVWIYAGYLIVKMTVIIGAHSECCLR